jgi:ribosomal protein S18 acetylase RimI-like enzyme
MIQIRFASINDVDILAEHDVWIKKAVISKKISDSHILVAYDGPVFIGWLRYSLFWDNTPYMNMLHLVEKYRGKGIGKSLVEFWEQEMRGLGYKVVLTSSAQTELAQHFYVKLGYKAIGSFILADEPLEIIFSKFI